MTEQIQQLRHSGANSSGALRLQRLVIDVRKNSSGSITAEAGCQNIAGANLVRHGGRGEDPEQVLANLIEAVEKLGIRAGSYRVVREDLPHQPVVEHRYRGCYETPSKKRSPGEEHEIRGNPLRDGGECEEEHVAEEGEPRGCSYCPCMNETESGETRSEYRAGAHQG